MKPKKRGGPLKIFRQTIQTTLLLLLSLVLIAKAPAYADNHISEYKVKAVYLYNFTKFISWPESTLPDTSHTINICVVGKNPFGSFLEPLTQLKAQDKALTVEFIENLDALETKNCQILFIAASEKDAVAKILKKTSTRHILTVSDMEGFAQHVGMIGFVVKDNKVRLEINLSAARQAGLKISAKLLEIATVIQ
ncbi:MAG: YfiR family protein [Proteobacteria bacterium]|nr:YfiR family protein [Pseudomonadota bacterium]MBU1638995.1 YfiR family protein [Pseudomonadota bacterium]